MAVSGKLLGFCAARQFSDELDRRYSQKCKPNKIAEFARIIIDEAVNWVFQEVVGTN